MYSNVKIKMLLANKINKNKKNFLIFYYKFYLFLFSSFSVEDFKEGFVIPLAQIKKSYSSIFQGIYVVKIETRDGYLFSITTANARRSGKDESAYLNELINSSTLLLSDIKNLSLSTRVYRIEQDTNVCSYYGEGFDPGWKFCKNCGKEI